jgi:hypothetical protein
MCKEQHAPIYQQGFTHEDLKQLHADSNAHVEDKKATMETVFNHMLKHEASATQVLRSIRTKDDADKFLSEFRFYAGRYFIKAGKKLPPSRYFGDDIINAIVSNKNCPEYFQRYLLKLYAKQ